MIDLPGQQQAGGVAAAGDAQATAGLVEMTVDGVLGNAQAARDLLGVQVFGDQAEAFPLARSEPFYRHRVVTVPHKRGGKCSRRLSSIPLVKSVSIRRPWISRAALADWGSDAYLAHPKKPARVASEYLSAAADAGPPPSPPVGGTPSARPGAGRTGTGARS